MALPLTLAAGSGEDIDVTQLLLAPSGTGDDATGLSLEVLRDGGDGVFDRVDDVLQSEAFLFGCLRTHARNVGAANAAPPSSIHYFFQLTWSDQSIVLNQ